MNGSKKQLTADSQRYVLACMMNWPDHYFVVCDILKEEMFTDFHGEPNRVIFKIITDLNAAGEKPDRIAILRHIIESKLEPLFHPNPTEILRQLQSQASHPRNIKQHAQSIASDWMQKLLIEGCSNGVERCKSGENPYKVAEDLEETIYTALGTTQKETISTAPSLSDQATETLKSRAEARISGVPTGIATGIADFDNFTGGFKNGRFYVIGGRPGMGKTTFMVSSAIHQAKNGYKVGFMSLEMNKVDITLMWLANLGRIYRHHFENGNIGNDQFLSWDKYNELRERFDKLNIVLDDTPGLGLMDIRNKAKIMKMRHSIDILYFDYIQIAKGKNSNRNLEIGEISNVLTQLSKTLNIPVVAGSQLSRNVEIRADKRPLLSDLRESGNIEQDAAMVIFPFRAEYYGDTNPNFRELSDGRSSKGIIQIDIAKNRFGKTGEVEGRFYGEFGLITGKDIEIRQGNEYRLHSENSPGDNGKPEIDFPAEKGDDFDYLPF